MEKMEICEKDDLRVIIIKNTCLRVNMGIEVQIEKSMGYVEIRENLSPKMDFVGQTKPDEI